MKHGWVITRDHIAEEGAPLGTNLNAVGVSGPRDMTATVDEIMEAGQPFRMYDDDDTLYYEGFVLGDPLAPLSNFGLPNAGAVYVKILIGGQWRTV